MSSVLQFKPKPTTDEYFGGCPHCGQNDGFMNVERDHWFVCDRHRTKWLAGSNLFSGWRDEDEATFEKNRLKLAEYMVVKPIHPEPTPEERERMQHHEYELKVLSALGAVGSGNSPIDPANLFDLGRLDEPHEYKPDRLCILTGAGRAYTLKRSEAYAAYEAMKNGDSEAIPTLLRCAITKQLRESMHRHWLAGLRPPEFQRAVRHDCPAVTLEEFNTAADEEWVQLVRSDEETAT